MCVQAMFEHNAKFVHTYSRHGGYTHKIAMNRMYANRFHDEESICVHYAYICSSHKNVRTNKCECQRVFCIIHSPKNFCKCIRSSACCMCKFWAHYTHEIRRRKVSLFCVTKNEHTYEHIYTLHTFSHRKKRITYMKSFIFFIWCVCVCFYSKYALFTFNNRFNELQVRYCLLIFRQ